MRLTNVLRASLAVFMAVAMPLDLSAQQMLPYFRWNYAGPISSNPTTPPPPTIPNDWEEGTGDLRIYVPLQVRARYQVNFQLQLGLAGPTAGVVWESVGSPLPDGLTLTSTGALIGRPTQTGTYPAVRVRATNARGESGLSKPFTIDSRPTPTVTVTETTSANAGNYVEILPTKLETWGSQAWSLNATLPVGMVLDASTGAIRGRPQQKGAFEGYRLTVVDSDGAVGVSNPFSIVVDSNLSIEGLQASYVGRLGQAFTTVRPYVTGGSGTYAWTLSPSGNALPPGLSLASSTGAISGSPTTVGEYGNILLSVEDYLSQNALTARAVSIRIAGTPSLALGTLFRSRVGSPLEIEPVASQVLGAANWSLNAAPPPGTTFSTSTGKITGTPSQVGSTAGLVVRMTDGFDGATASVSPFTVDVRPPLTVSDVVAPKGKVGVPYEIAPPNSTGLMGLGAWEAVGTFPPGLSAIAIDGSVVGTPTQAGTFNVGLRLRDNADGATATTTTFPIQIVGENEELDFEVGRMSALYTGEIGKRLTIRASVTGAKGPVSWALEGPLPGWATFSQANGSIDGMPNVGQQYPNLRLVATDTSTGQTARSNYFWIQVTPMDPLSVTVTNLEIPEGAATKSPPPVVRNSLGDVTFALASGTAGIPDGLAINPSTGSFEGRPVTSGEFPGVVVSATDSIRGTANSAPFTIKVTFPGTLSYGNGSGRPNEPLSITPTQAGLRPAVAWEMAPGSVLPSWATLETATGRVTGTPTEVGTYGPYAVLATDAFGRKVRSNNFLIGVSAVPVLSVSMSDKFAQVGVGFQADPTASGARGGLNWSIAGTLPAGLNLDPLTGRISGVPTVFGTSPGLVLTAVDDAGGQASTAPFSITVARSPIQAYGPSGLYSKHVGSPLALPAPTAVEPIGAVTWSVQGDLPPGMTVSSTTGIVSGTPNTVGIYENIALVATDAENGSATAGRFTIQVVPAPSIEIASPYRARLGYPVAFNAIARDTIGGVTWSLASGTLPSWLSFDARSGRFTGTPTTLGQTSPVTLSIVDGEGASATSGAIVVQVESDMVATLVPNEFTGRVGVAFQSAAPTVVGQMGDVAWRLASGPLPSWASVDPATGSVIGTPTAQGTFQYSLTGRDSAGYEASTAQATVTILPPAAMTIASTTSVRVGATLNLAPSVTGAVSPASFTLASGTLPGWITFNPASGRMSGEPTEVGTVSGLTIRMRDGANANLLTQSFTINVTPGLTIGNVPDSVVVRQNRPLSAFIPTVSGLIGTASWTTTTLPQGVLFTLSNGRVYGTPTGTGGTATITVTDSHDGAKASKAFTVDVVPTLAATIAPSSTIHATKALTIAAPAVTGRRGTASWSVASGTLPSWAILNANGSITGTPPTAGTFTGLRLRVTDTWDNSTAETNEFSITVLEEPAVINMATNYTARFGFDFTATPPTLFNGIGAVTWEWGPTATPPSWLNLDPNTGRMTGRPNSLVATPNLTVVGRDSTGMTARSVPFSMNVYSEPSISVSNLVNNLRVGGTVSVPVTTSGIVTGATYAMIVESGALPQGVTFSETTGRVSGTATGPGEIVYRVRVTDGSDGATATTQTVTIRVAPQLTISGLPSSYVARVGVRFDAATPAVAGTQGTITWQWSPNPSGLNLDANGKLNGTPSSEFAQQTITLTARDNFDMTTASASFTFRVFGEMTILGTGNILARNGLDVGLSSFTPVATNVRDSNALRWELSAGTLPNGVTVNETTGRLQGTPTGYSTQQTFSGIKIRATDIDTSKESAAFSITVYPTLSASIATTAYSATVTQSTSTVAPSSVGVVGSRTWSYVTTSGTQPTTISQNSSTGAVTFTPHAASVGTWTFVIRVRDSVDGSTADTAPITVTISPMPTLTFAQSSVVLRQNADIDRQNLVPTPANLVAPLSYTYAGGPLGVTANASTGQIVGSTSDTQTSYNMTVTAKDSRNISASATVTIQVQPGISPPSYAGTRLRRNAPPKDFPLAGPTLRVLGTATYSLQGADDTTGTYVVNPGTGTVTVSNVTKACASNGSFFSTPPANVIRYLVVTDSFDGSWGRTSLNYLCANALTVTTQPSTQTFTEGVNKLTGMVASISAAVSYPNWTATGLPSGLSVIRTSATSLTDVAISGTPAAGTAREQPYKVTITGTDPWDDTSITTQEFDLYVNPNNPPITFDPAASNPGLTYSSGNVTVQMATGLTGARMARTTRAIVSGKRYFEVRVNNVGTNSGAGIAGTGANLSSYLGDGNDSAGITTQNAQYYPTNSGTGLGGASNGHVFMVAVDMTTRRAWYGRNGIWNGNPAAGTGGFSIPFSGDVYPAVSLTTGASWSVQMSSTSYTPPSGFSLIP